jgi:hypothetical protein
MVNRTKTVVGFTLVFVAMMWGVLVLRAYLSAEQQIAICYSAKYERDVFADSLARCVGVKENELKDISTSTMAHILDENPRARYLVRQRTDRMQVIKASLDSELLKWDSEFRIIRIAACVATLGSFRKIESPLQFLPGIIAFIVILGTGLYFIHDIFFIPSENSPKESE